MEDSMLIPTLLHDWLAGNDGKFKPLFEYYFPRLKRYTLSYTGDPAISEELAMNVMLKVWQQQSRIATLKDFNSYLFTMMRHETVSMLRRKKTMLTLSAREEEAPATENITEIVNYRELLVRYQACLEKLPPRRREAFVLNRERGMSYAEIAALLNVSIFTVQNHIAASLKFIRRELHDYADFLLLAAAILLPMLSEY
ncbi:sigma-70 family RNA polymerase sigma factor [Chitinophaga nivalis]|uniref:Sigma-70 family RNA polymerase sigma factor n=1 Tax=Chitinophaga nivalis TaxID=2991709 RepID=A0ABT3IM39_9BACT|nr:sigma-70 family RNA polymerase sigma factor [Chitinophaga nivalis]MCW3465290.1 sigma-70 family RNA polymerase sigma factor [Chitinophaga nivalis]MCW3485018.1 sigma-70 family RNA polymerase sigma factor [Chitinophaga nivalis]